jgi:hypothetical protein
MNQETFENLPLTGGFNAKSAPGQEAAPGLLPSADSSRNDLAIAIVPAHTGSRAARNRRERERNQRRRAENRRTLAIVKAFGCWLCMRRDLTPDELHFHHLDPKKKRDCVAHLINRSAVHFSRNSASAGSSAGSAT